MIPKSIETKVYDWFNRRYPGGPQWTSSDFDCYRAAPLELRMVIASEKLEGEITNGGLPQLLWNVFFHWRHVLDDSEAGYDMIGAGQGRPPDRNIAAYATDLFRNRFKSH